MGSKCRAKAGIHGQKVNAFLPSASVPSSLFRAGSHGQSSRSERAATVRVFLTVGFSLDDEPTVNFNCELTVATSSCHGRYEAVVSKS